MKNILYITLAILVVFISFAVIALFFSSENTEYDNVAEWESLGLDIIHESERISNIIDKVGTAQAYENFKDVYKLHDLTTQHAAAHIFGTVLYEKEGVPGVVICDNAFSFGCYHAFFLKALSEQGAEIILEMERVCIEKYGAGGLGCQHGIGHGLVEYMGPNGLLEALDACATLAWKEPLFGCQSGVFMEYTLPTIIDLENSAPSIRDIDIENPYDVCPELPGKFRQACYYSLGQWWETSFGYAKVGQWCGDIISGKERKACYLGVGHVIAPSSNFDVSESIRRCKKMPDFEGELICRAGASWGFFVMPEYESLSPALCEGIGGDSMRRCVQESDLTGGEIH